MSSMEVAGAGGAAIAAAAAAAVAEVDAERAQAQPTQLQQALERVQWPVLVMLQVGVRRMWWRPVVLLLPPFTAINLLQSHVSIKNVLVH